MPSRNGKPSSHAVELLESEATRDDLNYNGYGSNALILFGKKKSKLKGKGKFHENKNTEAADVSRSKQRKLKKLEEEKQKKLLQTKSISLLRKYTIPSSALSCLYSSKTIGRVETMKEKRRRTLQYSKAGLEVPDEISLFKKKGHPKVSVETVQVLGSKEADDEIWSMSYETHSKACTENKPDVDIEFHGSPHVAVQDKDTNMAVLHDQDDTLSISNNCDKFHHTNLQGTELEGLELCSQSRKADAGIMVQKHVNRPTVVHVSRPPEIEDRRRDLPIIMMEQEIMEAINEHTVVILCGETGCGKTTQVPQFLYEAGYGSSDRLDRKGVIGVTQPRRVAVLSTAKRVSFEMGLQLGKEVGFQVRHDKMIGSSCSMKFMTDGILLREIQGDFLLRRYSVIILDEAHERSLNTDILIGMLSRVIKIRQTLYSEQQEKICSGVSISPENLISQLKFVLMSATLRVEDFSSNRKLFHVIPPIIEVPVRQFPVTVHFSKRTQEDYLVQAYRKVMSIHKRLPPGGLLVFVTGQREVEFLCRKLRRASHFATGKNSTGNAKNEIAPPLEAEMKEISDAYNDQRDPCEHQTGRFSSSDDADNILDGYSDYSYSSVESEVGDDSEDADSITFEAPEMGGLVSDFLRDSESMSSLKASFEALGGKPRELICEDKTNIVVASSKNKCSESTNTAVTCSEEKCLESTNTSAYGLYVLPLYAMLPASAQLRVFEDVPEGQRLVVVATNAAETSLTIPGIKYVVDTGKEKVKNYNCTNGMATYEVQWISKASAAQRAGRAGRTGPGHCYRLYSSAAYSKNDLFPEFSSPEIWKVPVDGIVLLMKFMGIDKVANFPFPTPPETVALVEAEHCLKALEAVDSQGRLTSLGKAMAQYPMSPRHSRMLLTLIRIMDNQQDHARANFILAYAVAAAAALSYPSPFLMQFGENNGATDEVNQAEKCDTSKVEGQPERKRLKKRKALASEARARFCNPSSDSLTVAYALQLFELAENLVEFCQSNSLHLRTMEDMSRMRKQLLQLIFHHSKFSSEFAWNHGSFENVENSWRTCLDKQPLQLHEEELLRQAICAGWADRVAKRVQTLSASSDSDRKLRAVRYQSCALKDIVYLHRTSSVSPSAPEYLVYSELLHTKRPYLHGVTSVKPNWLFKYASSLCTFSAPLTDPKPYYESLGDEIFCWVSPAFGQHNWQLPLHSLPVNKGNLRLAVFACALLKGDVLPCMRSIQKFLAAPPSMILKPEGLGQQRVGDLLSKMNIGSKTIDSRVRLREAWHENPWFMYTEIQNWFVDSVHDQFRRLWEHMHREVLLEGCELFPKRAKKGRKQNDTVSRDIFNKGSSLSYK